MDRAHSPRPRPETAAADRKRHAGDRLRSSPFAPLAHALLLAGATAAVFLAGKPQAGAMGVFLVAAGLAMIVCPPQVRVEWRLWVAAAAAVGCAALALLPETLVSQPAWRRTFETTPPIVMPGTITVSPALTQFWLAVLALSLLTGLFLLSHPIRSRWLFALALTATLTAAVYGALAIYAKRTGWVYPFASAATFGFFPNRNHTATLLFVGGLLALGVVTVALREGRWLAGLLAGAALAVCVAGVGFYSPSRAGVVFLLVGVIGWVAGLGSEHRDARMMISLATMLVAGAFLFLIAGGEARDRLLGWDQARPAPVAAAAGAAVSTPATDAVDPMHNLSTDFRLKIFRDAIAAISDFPLTGMGLGTFPLIFAQYRRASISEAGAIHPESDWLMLVAEVGIPAGLAMLAFLGLAAARLDGVRAHPYWPLRWGCAVAAGAAALHALVDVPLHRVQLGWWVLVIAGLALQSTRFALVGRSRVQHALFIAGGVAALTLGAALVRAQWFGGPPLPPFVAEKAQADIRAVFRRPDVDGATEMARRAIKASPLDAPLYYQFGALLLHSEDTDAQVDQVFKAQRVLSPTWPAVPRQQGDAWIAIDPRRAATLWLEALGRQQRIDLAQGVSPTNALGYYRDLIAKAQAYPDAQAGLRVAAAQAPAYTLAWLEGANPKVAAADFNGLGNQAGLMQRFSENERRRFLLLWDSIGDKAALGNFLAGHPDWRAAAWPVHLKELADAHRFEALVREVAEHYRISLGLPAPRQTGATAGDPASTNAVVAAFVRYWQDGNTVAARHALDDAAPAADQPPPPPEYWRLKAALEAQDLDWNAAWQALERFVKETQRAEVLP